MRQQQASEKLILDSDTLIHPNSNGWIKFFTDSEIEIGYDKDVEARRASWSKGRTHGIETVFLTHSPYEISLHTLPTTDFHQFDVFESSIFESEGTSDVVARVIQCKIRPEHNYLGIIKDINQLNVMISNSAQSNITSVGIEKKVDLIPIDCIDEWLTVIIDLEQGQLEYKFAQEIGEY